MPPKKADNKPSKKTEQKKKEKVIEVKEISNLFITGPSQDRFLEFLKNSSFLKLHSVLKN